LCCARARARARKKGKKHDHRATSLAEYIQGMGAEQSIPGMSGGFPGFPNTSGPKTFTPKRSGAARSSGESLLFTAFKAQEGLPTPTQREAIAHQEAAAFAAYAKAFAEQSLNSMKAEIDALRMEVTSLRLAVQNAPEIDALKMEVASLRLAVQNVPTAPPTTPLEELKVKYLAELQAKEEFAFAGRALGLPSRVRTAGYSCVEAKAAGYSCIEARTAGYTLADMAQAGYPEARDEVLRAARAKAIRDDYTPFGQGASGDVDTDDEHDEDEHDDEGPAAAVGLPSPMELVQRWQTEIPALRTRRLSLEHTQALSTLAELLTGTVESEEPSAALTEATTQEPTHGAESASQPVSTKSSDMGAVAAQRRWLNEQIEEAEQEDVIGEFASPTKVPSNRPRGSLDSRFSSESPMESPNGTGCSHAD
jgi:hypothetical protein